MKKLLIGVLVTALIVLLASCDPSSTKQDNVSEGGILTPVKGNLDPKKPYDAYHHGLFDDQSYTYSTTYRDGDVKYPVGETAITYSAYIPEGFQVKSSVYVILIPDDTKAKDFARSEIGMQWINLASTDEDPFAVVFIEPENGAKWNIAQDPSGRDEASCAFAAFTAIRDKKAESNAFISVDKSGVRLVGYQEGAAMASIWAAAWPQLFANTTLINPTSYEKDVIDSWLDSVIYPVAIDSSKGYELGMKAREVAMPLFLYSDGSQDVVNRFKSLYEEINRNCSNPDTSRDRSLEVVEILNSSSADAIYDKAKQNNRFLGYPGGTIRGVFGAYTDSHFNPVWEDTTIDEYTRRWMVYVPSSYDGESSVPLVVALHGSSASITDLPEESRWSDVADKEGFIVLFVQGYPTGTPNPIPSWFSLDGGAKTDIDYLKAVVAKVQEKYNIDSGRIYLTGHSMGSMMTQAFAGSDDGSFFAAYGPVGYALGESVLSGLGATLDKNTNTVVLPMWFFKGEYDLNGYAIDDPSSGDGAAFTYWAQANNLSSRSSGVDESENVAEGKYTTYSYANNEIPLVKYTQVHESPHTYMPEESVLLWNWFKHWSRDAEGNSYFDNNPVTIERVL